MTDLKARLQATLDGRYTLERELPAGGMSRVFVAEELALGRRVVIKVLAPELAQELSAERFAREIRVSARLQHPNIVPVLSAGAMGDVPYYAMPFIEGESLRGPLARREPIPLADAVALLRDVARALAYAHARGVIHRDIKPENILRSEDAVVVADFGIAKAVDAARAEGAGRAATLTQMGMTVGTPAYMSPEQAVADPALDFRTDLYSWGVVAYEVLAGTHPFAGRESTQALVIAHLTEVPTSLRELRPDIPGELAALIARCLAKNAVDRPSDARSIVDALGTLNLSGERDRGHAVSMPAPMDTRPSVAVLPMVNTSGNPENEPLSDGLTDELIGALGKLAGLKVTGRTSVFALKGRGLSVRAIAETLGVSTVLEGTLRRAGQRLKVSAQLVRARDDVVLWAETYDRELADIFAVQEDIAQAIAAALRVQLGEPDGPSGTVSRLVEVAPANLEAYELFLKARFISRQLTPSALNNAVSGYEAAIARDPTYARPYAALADMQILQAVFGGAVPLVQGPIARRNAERSVALASELADAHWALGHVLFAIDFDLQSGMREFQRALALEPGHAQARHYNAIILLDLARFDEAISELQRTLQADPLAAEASMTLGRVYMSMGNVEAAIGALQQALELSPGFSYARGHLGHAYLQQGRPQAALAEFERAVTTGASLDEAQLAYALAVCGRRDEAHAIVEKLLATARETYTSAFHIAMAYVGLGEIDAAFDWLERARDEHDAHVLGLNNVPAFAPLRGDPRFKSLTRRLGLTA